MTGIDEAQCPGTLLGSAAELRVAPKVRDQHSNNKPTPFVTVRLLFSATVVISRGSRGNRTAITDIRRDYCRVGHPI
jgi:hypothetical protein